MIDPYITKETHLDFRVWSKNLKRFLRGYMEVGSYMIWSMKQYKKEGMCGIYFDDSALIKSEEEYDSFIVQRPIGLKDKEGTDIFEGDILGELYDGEWCAKGVVNYNKDEALFYLYYPSEGCLGNFGDLENDTKELMIIGNLFENEELLKPAEEEDD